ncbi:O-antigen ligase family protein [Altererythrobacter sp. Root672]|uniref:O-antigen ligase family protein n=1 Tax=Altererythrobacter sp. Root672 TaxID=1736584 RepID=UPI0006F867B9|nr:O-antigen ligase family protein [Altererythrobacter sp. Root672]KRA83606.1 hypothetical protein ASD76_06120 [Altererythrobacter sp. Root672]
MANRLIVIAACFFLPWQLVRLPQENLSVSDMLFAAASLVLLLSGKLRVDVFGRLTIFWIGGLALMLGGLLVSSLASGEPDRWMPVAAQYLFALLVIPMVLRSCDRLTLQTAVTAFVVAVAISQLIGLLIIQFLTYDDVAPYVGQTVLSGNGRLGTLTGEPNSNGAVCVYALVMLLHCAMDRRMPIRIAVVCGGLIVAGLIASASFSAVAAGVLAISLFLVLGRFSNFVRFAVPLALVAVTYVWAGGPLPKPFEDRVVAAIATGDLDKAGTFTGRTHLVAEAWQMANDNMLIGLGTDRYREVNPEGMPVHNLHLLVLNEGGAVAGLGLTAMLVSMCLTSLLIWRNHRLDGAACAAITAAFFIYTMSIPHMYARIWIGPTLIVFALAFARYERATRRDGPDLAGNRSVRDSLRATG